MIETGRVLVGGAVAQKSTRLVSDGENIRIEIPTKYVSRGGEKLEAALAHFGVDPTGLIALDAGSSTGGFTDCLLKHNVEKVISVDTGTNQLHENLRVDERVLVYEKTDIRELAQRLDPVDLVVADLSFISLTKVVPALLAAAGSGAPIIYLVKPQFEATRSEADRSGGVITEPEIWSRTVAQVNDAFNEAGAAIMGVMVSPIRGGSGNVEFLVHAVAPEYGSSAEGSN